VGGRVEGNTKIVATLVNRFLIKLLSCLFLSLKVLFKGFAKYINKYVKSAMSTSMVSCTILSDFPEMLKTRFCEHYSQYHSGLSPVLFFVLRSSIHNVD